MIRRLRSFFLLSGLALLLAGCPHRSPTQVPPEDRISKADDLLLAVEERGNLVKSLRASGTIDMRRGGKRIKAHMLVLLRRPAGLRFETESFFDQPLSILVTDGMDFSLWDMDKGRFIVGKATPSNISRVIPIPMDGPEVAGILMGDPPLIPFARSEVSYDEDSGLYRLVLSNARQRQEIRIHPARLRPTEVKCHLQDKLHYRLDYQDWIKKKDKQYAPRKILFEMPAEKIRLKVKIREAEFNPDLQDKLFVLTPPEGIQVELMNP